MDALGIVWEYEPEGFHCDYRLTGERGRSFRYLPDFYLPELDVYAEAKATLTETEARNLLCATACLPVRKGEIGGLVMLGSGVLSGLRRLPARLSIRPRNLLGLKGSVMGSAWIPNNSAEQIVELAFSVDVVPGDVNEHVIGRMINGVFPHFGDEYQYTDSWKKICEAYSKANSARFEWGESG
jgi:hypothetical protein